MKKLNKKYLIVTLLAVVLCAAKSVSPYPDFSGTWVLDSGKSDIKNQSLAYKKIIVSRQADTIIIENMLKATNGADSSSAEKFSFTGDVSKKVLPNTSHGVDTRYRSIIRSSDGQSLIMKERNELDAKGLIQITYVTDIWTILPSGELMITSTFKFPDTTLKAKAVYHRNLNH